MTSDTEIFDVETGDEETSESKISILRGIDRYHLSTQKSAQTNLLFKYLVFLSHVTFKKAKSKLDKLMITSLLLKIELSRYWFFNEKQ